MNVKKSNCMYTFSLNEVTIDETAFPQMMHVGMEENWSCLNSNFSIAWHNLRFQGQLLVKAITKSRSQFFT